MQNFALQFELDILFNVIPLHTSTKETTGKSIRVSLFKLTLCKMIITFYLFVCYVILYANICLYHAHTIN